MTTAVIITAAGSSSRMGAGIKKEYRELDGRPILCSVIETFLKAVDDGPLVVTIPPGDRHILKTLLGPLGESPRVQIVAGGKTRQQSVLNGLKRLISESPDAVLIHDGARPYITPDLIKATLRAVKAHGAAVPVVPSVNAMKVLAENGSIKTHLVRSQTVSAQTPQGFSFQEILSAHQKAVEEKTEVIDDTELYSLYCGSVFTVPGDPRNTKITYPGDLK